MKKSLIGNNLDHPHEIELSDIFMNALIHRYGTEKEEDLYRTLTLRHHFLSEDNEKERLAEFFISELNLSEKCTYEHVPLGFGSAIRNFLENLSFRASLFYEDKELDKSKKKINRAARFRARKYRALKEYDYFYKYFILDEIAREMRVEPKPPMRIPEISYETEEMSYERCVEEKIEAIIHAVRLHSDHVAFVTEEKVEEYVSRHLSLIEADMRLMERQVIIPDGRIDILARDREENLVIIEVKVEEDKDILWQCIHYPEKIRELRKEQNVRMITLCPDYREHIREHLKKIDGVEMFSYSVTSELGQVKEMSIKRI